MATKRLPAAERKKQILKSAIRVFARSTYHGATTKSISEEAGVTEALIYRYFGSKRTLFTAAIVETSARMVDGIEEILERHAADPARAIDACFRYYVQLLEKNEDLAKMIFLVLSELDQEDVRAAYLPQQKRALQTIGAAIERWKEMGVVAEEIDTSSAAWLFLGSYLILALVKHSVGNLPMDAGRALALVRPFLNVDLPSFSD